MNVVWSGDTAQRLDNIDISVAVATDNGLITPIVKNAIGLGVQEISASVKVSVWSRLGFGCFGLDQHCYPVSAWMPGMGDHFRTCKPPRRTTRPPTSIQPEPSLRA